MNLSQIMKGELGVGKYICGVLGVVNAPVECWVYAFSAGGGRMHLWSVGYG